jgi:multidrug efflux system outer membrane protein
MSKHLLPIMLLLTGCAAAPDYQRPVAPVPAVFPGQKVDASGTVTPATVVADWRTAFTDPQLQILIAAALEHNRDLRVAIGRVEEARALAGIAHADRFPALDVNAQRTASLTPGDTSSTGRPFNAQRYDVNVGISAFELDFWGRVKSLDAAARAGYLSSEEARHAFRAGLIADVATTWLTQLELTERLALAKATGESREQTRFLVGKRRDVGLAGEIDYLQADGAYQNARAESASLSRQQAAVANALNLLVGTEIAVTSASTIQTTTIVEPQEGLVSDVLLARPDIRAAEQKLMAAHANIAAARAAFLPKILLTATAGTASRALSGLFAAGSGAWAFVPLLRLPIFDAGRNTENLDIAQARKNIAVAEYEKTVQQAFREVADLLSARQYLVAQLTAQEASTQSQGSRLMLVEARYKAGVSSHLELLDAQREHFSAQQLTLAVRRQQLATTANLYKVLGLL